MFYFLDYTKTFDNVNWNHLLKVLQEMSVPGDLIRLWPYIQIARFTSESKGELSEPFQLGEDVRQDCQ